MDTRETQIDLARRLIATGISDEAREVLEKQFPEVVESEDEKVRNEILIYIGARQDIDLETHNRWCAYLEKHKEQGKCPEYCVKSHCIGCPIYEKQKDSKFAPRVLPCSAAWFEDSEEKQKPAENLFDANETMKMKDRIDEGFTKMMLQEQKPAEKQDYSGLTDLERAILRGFLCAGVENVPVTIIKETAKDCLAQIKPAEWGEEDEKKLNRIYEILGHAADDKGFLTSKRIIGDKEAVELQDWLKSLRPTHHWKPAEWSEDIIRKAIKEVGLTQHQIDWFKTNVFPPKQEWSEEDEWMIESIISSLKANIAFTYQHDKLGQIDHNKKINWLKALHNRYLWKPSEEQMAYLAKAILYCIPEGDDKTVSVMKELHNDLKQL